ncbi:MAG: hypothetical protein ACRCY9_17585, partial [Phycicoccus sp.]
LAGNLTGIRPTAATWLTVWDDGPRPPVSNLNLARGATRPNAAIAGVSETNGYQVFNAAGTTEVLYDISGSFEAWPASLATLGGYPWPPAAGAASTAGPHGLLPCAMRRATEPRFQLTVARSCGRSRGDAEPSPRRMPSGASTE